MCLLGLRYQGYRRHGQLDTVHIQQCQHHPTEEQMCQEGTSRTKRHLRRSDMNRVGIATVHTCPMLGKYDRLGRTCSLWIQLLVRMCLVRTGLAQQRRNLP